MARGKGAVLELRNIVRSYPQGETRLEVLTGANLSVEQGEAVGLLGPSGSGKSTLLHIAGLLEKPDSGQVFLRGRDCIALSDGQRTKIRREDLGFVYSHYQRLMEHWRAVLPVKILEVEYEELVAAQEDTSRQMIAHVGLEWDDACLRFHDLDRTITTASHTQVTTARKETNPEARRRASVFQKRRRSS